MLRDKITRSRIFPSIVCLLFLLVPVLTYSQQTLETINQALRYSRYSRISPKIIPIQENARTFLLQIPVEKIEEDIEFDTYQFAYAVLSQFNEPITAQNLVNLQRADIVRETDYHYLFEKRVTIPEGQEMAFAVVQVTDTRQGDMYYYHVDLISPFVFGHTGFWAYYGDGVPFDQSFLSVREPIEFKGRSAFTLHSFHYPASFEPPLPPMEIRPPAVPKEIQVNYEGGFLLNIPKSFDQNGYYFIQSDTASAVGMMMKTVHEVFPRVKDYDEMVDMVVYISTRKEHEALLAAENKKIALDQYWYGLTKDEALAKKVIKEYFKQVEFANILFTDFKEGWKTDRGMVFTVMGPPNEVVFRLNGEIWSYISPDANSKITFTFTRVKNILTHSYYTLNRSRALQPDWFKSITTWRNGQMDF